MALYRLQQGIHALTAFTRPVDRETARGYLSPPLMDLFLKMRRSEQQHSLNVLRALRTAGHTDPDLMVAALLHDVGKSRVPFHLWDRALVVLVGKLCPGCLERWGAGPPKGWRRPWAVAVQHTAWGAEMVREAGGSARAVELIARSDASKGAPADETVAETERRLTALIEADNTN